MYPCVLCDSEALSVCPTGARAGGAYLGTLDTLLESPATEGPASAPPESHAVAWFVVTVLHTVIGALFHVIVSTEPNIANEKDPYTELTCFGFSFLDFLCC